ADFYEKELSFQVSCSYGPGRYDDDYEFKGRDYPIGYVRWTEKRNFEAILQAMAAQRLNVKPLISEVIELEDFQKIYGDIGNSRSIASILSYPEDSMPEPVVDITPKQFNGQQGIMGVIGAGNFTKMALLPGLSKAGANIKYIASMRGVSGTGLAKKFNITHSTTDYKSILADEQVDTIVITTQHNLHAPVIVEALQAGKHVFVEKPLALNSSELDQILEAYEAADQTVTVGFNRRFSPHAVKMKELIDPTAPKNIIATMNAGFIPAEVWVHDMEVGGGRIIGEACHHIDLVSYLTGSKVKAVCMNALGNQPKENTDNASILLKYENGDHAVINYFANGHKSYSKERLEVYFQNKNLIMDNFRTLKGYGTKGFSSMKTKIDKGHMEQFRLFTERSKSGGAPLIPFDSIVNTTKASFAAIESLKSGGWVNVQ
ncbi:MAG: Gfo/Idh/MocA family oxidoreductase, partial [Phaeodactylibacter sp.]|nr:Gfo/Idh/MocA family oxidoreductase [Phaeodactylibacter sp.]